MDTDYVEEEVVENPTLKAAYNLAPLHHNQPLIWDYEVDLIGEKIYDKVIHLCEICELPILVYGRMLPCKHVFCFDCARKCEKTCQRCGGRVQKVEKSALGTVYVCTFGAPKHNTKGCRRTYLSQRDLQSHIAHRHLPKTTAQEQKPAPASIAVPSGPQPLMGPQLPLTQQQAALQAAAAAQPVSQSSPASAQTPALPPSLLVAPGLPELAPTQQTPASLLPPTPHHHLGNPALAPTGGLGGDLIPTSSPSPRTFTQHHQNLHHHQQQVPPLLAPQDSNSGPMGVTGGVGGSTGGGLSFNNVNLPSQLGGLDQGAPYHRPLDLAMSSMTQKQPSSQAPFQPVGMMGAPITGGPGHTAGLGKTPLLQQSSKAPGPFGEQLPLQPRGSVSSPFMSPRSSQPQSLLVGMGLPSTSSSASSPSLRMTPLLHQQHPLQDQPPEQQLRQEHQLHHQQHQQQLLREQEQLQQLHLNLPPGHPDSLAKQLPPAPLMSSPLPRHVPHSQQQVGMDGYPSAAAAATSSSPGVSYEPAGQCQADEGLGVPSSRTNVNLITVPIQEEPPYRPPHPAHALMGQQHHHQSLANPHFHQGSSANLPLFSPSSSPHHQQHLPPGMPSSSFRPSSPHLEATATVTPGIPNSSRLPNFTRHQQPLPLSPNHSCTGSLMASANANTSPQQTSLNFSQAPGAGSTAANARMNNPMLLNPRGGPPTGMNNLRQTTALMEMIQAFARPTGPTAGGPAPRLMSLPPRGPGGSGAGVGGLNPRFNNWTPPGGGAGGGLGNNPRPRLGHGSQRPPRGGDGPYRKLNKKYFR